MGRKIRRCAVLGCVATSSPGDGRMHRFPRNIDRLKHWAVVCGNEDLLNFSPTQIHQGKFVCPKHFCTSQYFDGEHRSYLGRWAKPTLFLPEPLSEEPSWSEACATNTSGGSATIGTRAGAHPDSAHTDKVPIAGSCPPDGAACDRATNSGVPSWFLNPGTSMPMHAVSPAQFTIQNGKSDEVLSPFGKRLREEDEAPCLDLQHLQPPAKVVVVEVVETRRRSTEILGARDRTSSKRMSRQRLATVSGVNPSTVSDDGKKILRSAFEYRRMALRIRCQLQKTQKVNGTLRALSKRKFIDMIEEMTVSPRLRKMLKAELRNFKRRPKGREWTQDDKYFALALYKRSPRAYRFLRQHLVLPSESALKSVLSEIPLEPGISKPLISLLKRCASKLKKIDKNCVILFDEIYLRGLLQFNKKTGGIVDGLENYGNRGRTNLVADHALVFMVQGINLKWTQPVAYYFVHKTCPSDMLKILICDVVQAVQDAGLNVVATVSDQGPTNRGAISLLKQSSLQDDIIYTVNGHRLVHIYDVPHLFKNSRNNLLSSDLEYKPGSVAKWRHIIEFYKLDCALCQNSNLTLKHVNPQGRHRMRVKYAAETISDSVVQLIDSYIRLSHGRYLKDCIVTANLFKDIDLFFDLTNGPSAADKRQKDSRVNVSSLSLHHEQWPIMIKKITAVVIYQKIFWGETCAPFCPWLDPNCKGIPVDMGPKKYTGIENFETTEFQPGCLRKLVLLCSPVLWWEFRPDMYYFHCSSKDLLAHKVFGSCQRQELYG